MLTGRELLSKVKMLNKTATTGAMLDGILSSRVHDEHQSSEIDQQSVDRGGDRQGKV